MFFGTVYSDYTVEDLLHKHDLIQNIDINVL